MVIRPATVDDIEALTDLSLRSKAWWGYDETFIEKCRDELTMTVDRIAAEDVRVAEVDDGIVGYVSVMDGSLEDLHAEAAYVFYGLSPNLGPIADWGLDIDKRQLPVDTEKFQTSEPGVYAVGDINTYPGKKKLILSGFHEAALAAFAVQQHIHPEQKVRLQYTTTSPLMHKRLGIED